MDKGKHTMNDAWGRPPEEMQQNKQRNHDAKQADMQQIAQENAAADLSHTEYLRARILKFQYFFSGLIFGVLSLSIRFHADPVGLLPYWLTVCAWPLFLIAGCISLRDAGGFTLVYNEKNMNAVGKNSRRAMYACLLVAMVCLIVSEAINAFPQIPGVDA
ncbi:MAG: hypothetical protein HRU15_01095 [Planctomycetes bacterium]|nr:hypothetical protein [Planctomycetota bacterium]